MEINKEGHECTCGKYHEWPLYVFSHWGEALVHKCKMCGRKVQIKAGEVTELEPGN